MPWALLMFLVACSKDAAPPPPAPAPVSPPVDAGTPGIRAKVFADSASELPLSIAIETLGGISTVVLAKGTVLPAHFSDVFSTMADDQPSVEVHITAGERPFAKDNKSLGKFQVYGLPPAPRGVPQIDVDLDIDATGVLTVTATDRATGTSRSMRITGDSTGPLARAGIEQSLRDAVANHDLDVTNSTRVHAHIDLEQLRIGTRRTLAEAGDKVPAKLRVRIEAALASADRVNADWAKGDAKTIVAETEKLRAVAHEMSTKLYGSAAP